MHWGYSVHARVTTSDHYGSHHETCGGYQRISWIFRASEGYFECNEDIMIRVESYNECLPPLQNFASY